MDAQPSGSLRVAEWPPSGVQRSAEGGARLPLGGVPSLPRTLERDLRDGTLVSYLRGDAGRMILFGVVILIIAKAFEMGIKLEEDQKLTV